MWESYILGESPARRIVVSKEFFDVISKFREDKGMSIQLIFEAALLSLWRIWNNQGIDNICESHATEMKVRNIFINSNPPGKKLSKNIHIQFRGVNTYDWFVRLEKLRMFEQPSDGIRRIIAWFLKEQGYL